MNINANNITAPTNPAISLPKPSGERFAQELRAVKSTIDSDGLDPKKAKTLRKTAEQLVATTFIMPMLAKMRDDPFKSDLFHGGQTEDIFGQRLDTILAERIVSKTNFSIVDAVYRSVADRVAPPPANNINEGLDAHG
jgi:Rod binding domain-containing protein